MIQNIISELEKRKYIVFKNGAVNIVAVRKSNSRLNQFNDELHCFVHFQDGFKGKSYPITTLPGSYWLANLMNPKGTAILKPGQYLEAYKLGLHKGKKALIQVRPVTVYRDNNKDFVYDYTLYETGLFGINVHRAGIASQFVNSWSAGCQVFQYEKDFIEFINGCEERSFFNNGKFTYTLIED